MHNDADDLASGQGESVRLLNSHEDPSEMAAYPHEPRGQPGAHTQYAAEDGLAGTSRATTTMETESPHDVDPIVYRVYKIRWFGLFQLVLLNIIVSWDVRACPPISTSSKRTN